MENNASSLWFLQQTKIVANVAHIVLAKCTYLFEIEYKSGLKEWDREVRRDLQCQQSVKLEVEVN